MDRDAAALTKAFRRLGRPYMARMAVLPEAASRSRFRMKLLQGPFGPTTARSTLRGLAGEAGPTRSIPDGAEGCHCKTTHLVNGRGRSLLQLKNFGLSNRDLIGEFHLRSHGHSVARTPAKGEELAKSEITAFAPRTAITDVLCFRTRLLETGCHRRGGARWGG